MIQFYRQLFIISMLLTVLTAAGFSVEKVHAEQLESLYDEQVLVLNQSEGERARAGRQAFERVFRRLTGKQLSGFVSAPPGNVDNYLEQFSYAPSDKFIESNSSGFEELLPAIALNFRFSSEAMGEYARRLGVPLWSANRPTTLVWMVVDRQGSREYLNEEGFGLEYGYIRQQDTLLGLPIIFPLHDLQDELVVSVEQVWDLDQDAIHQASLRYQADSILVVKVAETASGKWLGSWHYYLGGKGFDIGVESESLFGFLEAGIENLSGYLAQRFTVSDTLDHRVQLSVSGVRGFSALVDVRRFLKNINTVESVVLNEVIDDTVFFTLSIEGDVKLFQDLVALGVLLEPVETFSKDSEFFNTFSLLAYRYKPSSGDY